MTFKNVPLRYKIALGSGVPLLLMIVLAYVAISSSRSQVATNAMVDHTHKVIQNAMEIEAAAVNMETGMRGYLLAGKEEFLEPYKNGFQQFKDKVSKLKDTVSDNPAQVTRLEEIESTIAGWTNNVTEPAIELRRAIGNGKNMDDIADFVSEERGKKYIDKFRDQMALFIDRESKLLAEREAENTVYVNRSQQLTARLRSQGTLSGVEIDSLAQQLSAMNDTNAWVDHTFQVIASAQQILSTVVSMETGMRGYLLAGEEQFLAPYHQGSKQFEQSIRLLTDEVSDNPEQTKLLAEMKVVIDEWQKNVVQPMVDLRFAIGDSMTMNDIAEDIGKEKGKVYFDKFRNQIGEFIAVESELMTKRQAEADSAAQTAQLMIMAGTVVAIILGAIASWIVSNAITKPVREVALGLEALAKGDLTSKLNIDSKDELGMMAASYNQAVDKTNHAVTQVLATTDEVVEGSRTITNANNAMSKELEEQNGKVVQVSAAIEQIAVSIQDVASNSSEATATAQAAGVAADSGGNVVRNTIAGMNQISEAVAASSSSVAELGRRGTEIGAIITVINDIAEQTNLLALNAAIEAARAGEAGRGFAVVADEVRALADRTTGATKEIGQSIEAIQNETSRAVERMAVGSELVNEGLDLAKKAGASLDEIVSSAQNVAAMIDSIATATEQQSTASNEVSRNVEYISHASQSANEQANVAAQSANSLVERAETLRKLVNQFKV